MSKYEALRFEAETLSCLMIQLADNEIDSDSFAVMSNLGENGTQYDCDLPITETALRTSAVIDQLLAALEEANSKNYQQQMFEWIGRYETQRERTSAAEQLSERLQKTIDSIQHTIAQDQRRITELERDKITLNSIINTEANRANSAEQRALRTDSMLSESIAALKAVEQKLIALPSDWSKYSSLETWVGKSIFSTTAIADVIAERHRQISAKGCTPEHDDEHAGGEIADAAACYARLGAGWSVGAVLRWWPWDKDLLKTTEPRRSLVKAGALIIAEIERLDRSAKDKEE